MSVRFSQSFHMSKIRQCYNPETQQIVYGIACGNREAVFALVDIDGRDYCQVSLLKVDDPLGMRYEEPNVDDLKIVFVAFTSDVFEYFYKVPKDEINTHRVSQNLTLFSFPNNGIYEALQRELKMEYDALLADTMSYNLPVSDIKVTLNGPVNNFHPFVGDYEIIDCGAGYFGIAFGENNAISEVVFGFKDSGLEILTTSCRSPISVEPSTIAEVLDTVHCKYSKDVEVFRTPEGGLFINNIDFVNKLKVQLTKARIRQDKRLWGVTPAQERHNAYLRAKLQGNPFYKFMSNGYK